LHYFEGLGICEDGNSGRVFVWSLRESFDAIIWFVADEIANLDHHFQQTSFALKLEASSVIESQVASREVVKQ
jgi:hypothetical protein